MKVTQKARVALGEHQLASTGTFSGTSGYGLVAHCRCGWSAQFNYNQLPADDPNATPYIDGLMVGHQIEKMEAA